MTKDSDILFAFYASDRDDAEQQAKKIVKEQGYERIDLKAFPSLWVRDASESHFWHDGRIVHVAMPPLFTPLASTRLRQ